MKIEPSGPKPGRVWSLDVYTRPGRRRFARFLAKVEGVKVRKMPKLFSALRDESSFMEFEFHGTTYVVEPEPFSGNYFEIRPEPPGCRETTIELHHAMKQLLSK